MAIQITYFFLYAFLGWCTEVVYAAFNEGRFVNRGFLNGPLCPIYGFGVIGVIILLKPVHDNFLLLFAGSVLITSLAELITGFVLEKLFQHKWWDYSDRPFNIGGYICPMFSFLWGIACLVVVAYIHPLVIQFVAWIPQKLLQILLINLVAILLVDLVATIGSILKLNKKLKRIEEMSAMIKKVSDNIGENLATNTIKFVRTTEALDQKIEVKKTEFRQSRKITMEKWEKSLLEFSTKKREAFGKVFASDHFGQKRLLNAFPRMQSKKYKSALEKLKERTKESVKKVSSEKWKRG